MWDKLYKASNIFTATSMAAGGSYAIWADRDSFLDHGYNRDLIIVLFYATAITLLSIFFRGPSGVPQNVRYYPTADAELGAPRIKGVEETLRARGFRDRMLSRLSITATQFAVWSSRLLFGLLSVGYSDIISGDENPYSFWAVTLAGVAVSGAAALGQWIVMRQGKKERSREIVPVALRFVEK